MSDLRAPRRFPRNRAAIVAGAIGLLAISGGAGALAIGATRPSATMAPAVPVAIRALSDSDVTTIRGRVAEVYGNKFVIADATGRALVDTGRGGEGGALVRVGQPVTVQGRFDDGFVHAMFLVQPGGKVVVLGPPVGPHDRHGPHRDGRGEAGREDRGPADPVAPPSATPAA